MGKAYYVDLNQRGQFTLLAGPFTSEEIARKYEIAAFEAACADDRSAAFQSFGVISITDYCEPGSLNHKLQIHPADLSIIS